MNRPPAEEGLRHRSRIGWGTRSPLARRGCVLARACSRLAKASVVAMLLVTVPERAARADDDPALAATQARDSFVRDQRNLMTVLGAFSLGSIATGIPMMTSSRGEIRAAGLQNVAWGAVDGAIALIALAHVSGQSTAQESAAHWADERSTLRTVFAINVGLDVLYLTAGALLLALGKTDALRGTGGAVLAQGGFLFAFDAAGFFVMAPHR